MRAVVDRIAPMLLLLTACGGDGGGTTAPDPDSASGSLEVTTATIAGGLDRDGFRVTLDAGEDRSIGPDGTVTFEGVPVGGRTIELTDLDGGCSAVNDNPQEVTLAPDVTVAVRFEIECRLLDRIVFRSTRDGPQDVWVMGVDGSSPQNVTEHERADTDPVLSPQGTHIAFSSSRDGNSEIYVVEVDGSSLPDRLTDNESSDIRPAWSPDGSRIAFASNRDGPTDIFVVCISGASAPENLTESESSDTEPAWSPDGSRIAFRRTEGNREIYVMNADGSNPTRLTQDDAVDDSPAWSPQSSVVRPTFPEECTVVAP